MRLPVLLLLALLVLVERLNADEAILPAGKRIPGNAKWQDDGRLRWLADGRTYRLDELDELKFTGPQSPPLRAGAIHWITLRDGSRITGERLELDADSVRIGPIWTEKPLTLPRVDVATIEQSSGFATIVDDDFESDLKAWKLTGNPRLDERQKTSGKKSLLINGVGQGTEYSLPTPLDASRVGINFLASETVAGATWLIQCDFAGSGATQAIVVDVAGREKNYGITVPEVGAKTLAVPRSPGWHRLIVDFTSTSVVVQIDDRLLWTSEDKGIGAPLRRVALVCKPEPDAKDFRGEVWFDDFSVARSVDKLRHPPGDPTQDEVWLLTGDQLFGQVLRADRRQISLKGAFGQRTLTWGEVRGLHLRSQVSSGQASEGEHVRLWIDAGISPQVDYVEGVVKALTDRNLSLQMAERTIVVDRNRLRRLQGDFFGRRLVLLSTSIHLGKKLLPGAVVPQPNGTSFQTKFNLPNIPDNTRLVLSASHLKGPKDDPAIAKSLAGGNGRTEVVVNGKVVDYLNRLAEKFSTTLRPIVVPLPRSVLRIGENVLEFRQSLDRESGDFPDCILSRIIVDIPK